MRLAVLLLAAPAFAQQLSIPCEPNRRTIELLESVPPRDTTIPYEKRVGALRALAAAHPGDFFIQRAYQDAFRRQRSLADEYDRALAMYRARPRDPLSAYYEARLLILVAPQQSRKTFDDLLRAHPEFAWPRRDMQEWAAMPGRRDDPELAAHARAFAEACPDVFGDPNRQALERRNTPLEMAAWPALWRKEAAPGSIRADLKRIEQWPFRADPDLYPVYSEAARLLNDPWVLQSLRAKVERDAPESLLAFRFVETDWGKAHPQLDRNAAVADQQARQKLEIAAGLEWSRHFPLAWPAMFRPVMDLSARANRGPTTVSEADLEVMDRVMRVYALSPDSGEHFPPFEINAAELYVAGKVRLDRVPAMLDAGLRNVEKTTKYQVSPELYPPEMRARMTDWRKLTADRAAGIRADYLLAVNRRADARAMIVDMLPKLEGGDARQAYERQRWQRRLGDVEAAEGRVTEALAAYQASLAGTTRQSLDNAYFQETVAPLKRYYLAHGGTEEKWPEWALAGAKSLPVTPRPPEFTAAVPEFSAADLAGRVWKLGSLKGKVTFVNFWATWCGPCRYEHTGLQEMYERTKDRRDVQILTISVDEDAAAVRPYLKEKGYTFPVIHAPALAEKLFPWAGLPTNFVVDPRGMRSGLRGFGADSASVTRLIEELAKIAVR
jgi:thiol-disulfide isomerase/thioredoxin